MGIRVSRNGDRCVAQNRGDRFELDAVLEQERREGVPQSMKAYMWEARSVQRSPKRVADCIRMEEPSGFVAEDEVVVLPLGRSHSGPQQTSFLPKVYTMYILDSVRRWLGMAGVKVRKVGNSNVITVPRELERYGLVDGATVAFVPLRSGEVLIVPADRYEEYVREVGRQIVQRRRRALEKLEAHDQGRTHN